MNKELSDFSQGPLTGPMVRFAVPVFGALVLQTLYGIVDTLVISRYAGVAAISGISSGAQFMDSVTGIITALATAITVLVAQQKGAKNEREMSRLLSTCLVVFVVLSVGCTLGITLFAGPIVNFIKTPAEAYGEAVAYIRICGLGTTAIIAYNILGAFFNGLGNSKAPLLAVVVSFVINIAGDFFTIGYLGMGASGAAVTTVTAQCVSVVVTWLLFRKANSGNTPRPAGFRLYKEHIQELMKTGMPLMVNDFLLSFSFLLILMIVNSLGVEKSAAIGIAEKIFTLMLIFPKTCRKTLSVVVAQCMGAEKQERAVRATRKVIVFSTGIGVVLAAVLTFGGPALVGIFTTDSKLIQLAALYLKACAVNCLLLGARYGLMAYLLGRKKSNIVLVDGLVGSFLVRAPLAYLFSRWTGGSVFMVGMSIPISAVAEILLYLGYLWWDSRTERKGGAA